MSTVALATAVFVLLVLLLSALVLGMRQWLLPAVKVPVRLAGVGELEGTAGQRLLDVLGAAQIKVPAACGGAGTCGQCRVQVLAGGAAPLPTEQARLSRAELKQGVRLACQLRLREALDVAVDESLLHAEQWTCRVRSVRALSPLIRELVLDLPAGQTLACRPGSYVMLEAPPYRLDFHALQPSPEHSAYWRKLGVATLRAGCDLATRRAYSLANVPGDGRECLVLQIRLALPPPNVPDAPPGVVSSWLFARQPGDAVVASGPFGNFAAQDSQREMVFVGGGVGMAPLRAIIADLLDRQGSQRRISYWYGARSRIELFCADEFEQRMTRHANFRFVAALSDPAADDDWSGPVGFIHDVLRQQYLAAHPAPEDCEYYLCGPPLMIKAVLALLDDLGVDPERIFNDDFGSD